MSLLGSAVVAIWHDIDPQRRLEYTDWHNREHMPERVGIPGFLRGRRYVARYGSPEFFTLYEAETSEVLTGPDYLQRLNNPTPWTRKSITAFSNLSRGLCDVTFSAGLGDGAYILTLRFSLPPFGRDRNSDRLMDDELSELLDVVGVTSVHFCKTDREASGMDAAERRGMSNTLPEAIIMVEASLASAADDAADRLLSNPSNSWMNGADRGLYVLEISRLKDEQIVTLPRLARDRSLASVREFHRDTTV